MKLHSLMLATVAWTGLAASDLSSQVIISEVDFDSSGAWVELYNQSPIDFNLSNFSMYHATKTAFQIQDYWFAIPTGTVIKGKNYLRIYWGGKVPSTPPADKRNIYTGDTTWHFLFGHGYEKLDPKQGAIALCNTKLNSQMNNAGIFTDWIQWGGTNFKRGQTAINSKLWTSNTTSIPVGPTDHSLIVIYDERSRLSPPPLTAYDYDFNPTPLAHNASPLVRKSLGGACSASTSQLFGLDSNGFPFYGNKGFGLEVTGTEGPAFFEALALTFSFSSATAVSPIVPSCTGLDLNRLLTYTLHQTANGSTKIATPIHTPSSLKGATVFIQGVVLSPTYAGFTNILKLTFSN